MNKKFCLLLFCLWFSSNVFSQVGVTSYLGNVISLNTSKRKMFNGELKANLNLPFKNATFELSGMYNFKEREYHRFSIGLGLIFFPFQERDSYYATSLPLQLEIFPLRDFKRLSFVTEIAPLFASNSETPFRYLLGIRYTFK